MMVTCGYRDCDVVFEPNKRQRGQKTGIGLYCCKKHQKQESLCRYNDRQLPTDSPIIDHKRLSAKINATLNCTQWTKCLNIAARTSKEMSCHKGKCLKFERDAFRKEPGVLHYEQEDESRIVI